MQLERNGKAFLATFKKQTNLDKNNTNWGNSKALLASKENKTLGQKITVQIAKFGNLVQPLVLHYRRVLF
jgi:hypothetical protein